MPLAEAAAQTGLSVPYLEMLEREGLIGVKRTLDDVVVISTVELDKARVTALLTEELDVNLAGAEVILPMRGEIIAVQRQFDEILSDLVDTLKRRFAAPRAEER